VSSAPRPLDGGRVPVLYLAPWVDIGGSDSGTVDWFRWLDRDRFAPSLITTQPSPNRRLRDVMPYADEVWALPDLLPGNQFPHFILDFIHTRGIRVVHLMNSRLAFNLLPDIHCLPDRPAVVVQLHVEEPDGSGYVRLVASRYGNLVDAFSVTSRHLAEVMVNTYDVPQGKCRVIYLGVDGEQAFSPERAVPINGLEKGPVHIAYPGRLVEQKDPLLMVEVAARLKARSLDFRIHSLGDGGLEPAVRAAIAKSGLEGEVALHGPTSDMASWYAACDLVLMTSAFEGGPCVVYEAMAMGLPVVAPALPGNVELMAANGSVSGPNGATAGARSVTCGVLVEPRDDAELYASALAGLISTPEQRRLVGSAARRRALSEFSVERMATEHGQLYLELLDGQPRPPAHQAPPAPLPEQITCGGRPAGTQPPVSVIIPCFNHGCWLPRCLESVAHQTYPALEVIVVDDASNDIDTVELLGHLEKEGAVKVLRMEANSGPSAARNAAIAVATGRYILPLDADNVLLPDAVEQLVRQLQAAGELVAFIYPNQHYFGNREDYAEAPAYNLHNLLEGNYCDTCSLIDRTVFDNGMSYADDIGLNHEDWDIALQMAERGLRGEPAWGRTVLVRKWGFTRSDQVQYGADDFADAIRQRHPALYQREGVIKARWSPAVSIVALAEVPGTWEAQARLRTRIAGQSVVDAEVILRTSAEWPDPGWGPHVRRLAPALARSQAEAIKSGLDAARGRFLLLGRGAACELLADRAFVEKTIRAYTSDPGLGTIVFVDAGDGHHPFAALTAEEVAGRPVEAVAWSVHWARPLAPLAVAGGDALGEVALALSKLGPMQWRQTPAAAVDGAHREPDGGSHLIHLGGREPADTHEQLERASRLSRPPLVPSGTHEWVRRLNGSGAWHPPLTQSLCRHRRIDGVQRVVTASTTPPAGFAIEHLLGAINVHSLPGTKALLAGPQNGYRTADNDDTGPGDSCLGYLELAGLLADLPLLDPVYLAVNPATGERTLMGGDDDPLPGTFERTELLGFIEPLPLRPRRSPLDGLSDEMIRALALSRTQDESREARHQVEVTQQQLTAVWVRIDGIHNSLPGRIYNKLDWLPGLKKALMWRRKDPSSQAGWEQGEQD
jgi:glycosyltransferase involved in cell wall biosynthesis